MTNGIINYKIQFAPHVCNNITFLFIYDFLNYNKLKHFHLKHNFYFPQDIIYLIKAFIHLYVLNMNI